MVADIKAFLDKYEAKYNRPVFIESDPMSIPNRFSKLQDKEISGFWTAMLAWGRRKTIIDKAPEILLIGTGSKHKIIPGELLANLYDAKIAVEVMSTAAACRSYRLLASDNRSVTAALLIN